MTDDGLTAALLKITEHAERLGQLEASVTANLDECQVATAGLAGAITDLSQLVEEQGRLIESVSDLVKTIVPPSGDDPADRYELRPPVLWWKLSETQLRKEIDHLAAWVEQVYRPWYGHLATGLGHCWQDHRLVLVGLDVMSELHSVLTFQPKRTTALLSAQAEFQTRILPAFNEQFKVETGRCSHRPEVANGSTWRGAR